MNIIEEIGLSAALAQLAEECCELGKAALKLQRIVDKRNPTPVTRKQAEEDLIEEAADVVNSVRVLQS